MLKECKIYGFKGFLLIQWWRILKLLGLCFLNTWFLRLPAMHSQAVMSGMVLFLWNLLIPLEEVAQGLWSILPKKGHQLFSAKFLIPLQDLILMESTWAVFLPTRKNMTLLIRGEKLISFKHPIELLSELFLSIIFVYLCNSSYNLLKLAHFIPFFFHLFDRNLLKK